MRLYYATATKLLSLTAGSNQTSISIPAKLGTTLLLEVIPDAPLGQGATGVVSVKPKGNYASSVIARALSWTPPSTSDGGYILLLDFNTTAALGLFSATPVPDIVNLMADLTVVDGGVTSKTQTFAIVLANQVSSADEASPSSVVAAPSFLLSSADGSQWQIAIGNDGTLTQTKL